MEQSKKKWLTARKKPIEVEFREVFPDTHIRTKMPSGKEVWGEVVNTGHEGSLTFAYPDEDFIIRDSAGEYPIKKAIFWETYDIPFPNNSLAGSKREEQLNEKSRR